MSAVWKVMGIGGAAKRDTLPCHCCPITSEDLAVPNPTPCDRFCRDRQVEDADWRCYHHRFMTDDSLEFLKEELDETRQAIENLVPQLDAIIAQCRLRNDEDPRSPRRNSTIYPKSIHFNTDGADVSKSVRENYSKRVSDDLITRDISAIGNLKLRQKCLKDAMEREWLYISISSKVKHAEKGLAGELIVLIESVPCILHMENRVGLKIFSMLLMEGLSNTIHKLIFEDVQAEGGRIAAFMSSVHLICNTEIWGTDNNPWSWQIPYEKKEKKSGAISLDNNKTRVLMSDLHKLIDVCVTGEDRQFKWHRCIQGHNAAMELMRQKRDFIDSEIQEFQYQVDKWSQDWVGLHGIAGITNYIHLLSSGHVSSYLFYWRNLYAHSQQGWEAFNSLLKTFYFRRTSRGGGAGNKGTGTNSRILPIARWVSRRVIWMMGTSYDDIRKSNDEILYEYTTEEEAESDLVHGI